jgi:hypothetical protein
MKFDRTKLPKEAIKELREVPFEQLKAKMIMGGPVYVLLSRNEKFVAVKAPLHFFTPGDIEKLKGYESVYIPRAIDGILPFQRAGEAIRKVVSGFEIHSLQTSQSVTDVLVPNSTADRADAQLRILANLWGKQLRIEPFFLVFLAIEFYEEGVAALPELGSDQDVERTDLALLRASTALFLALHLGGMTLPNLVRLYRGVFEATLANRKWPQAWSELDQIAIITERLIPHLDVKEISCEQIAQYRERAAVKISGRLARVSKELTTAVSPVSSLYSKGGFRHGG